MIGPIQGAGLQLPALGALKKAQIPDPPPKRQRVEGKRNQKHDSEETETESQEDSSEYNFFA